MVERLEGFENTHWLEVFTKYCLLNRLFVLPARSTDDWPARKLWATDDGRPNVEYLKKKYGSATVPVIVEARCEPVEETLGEYLEYCDRKKGDEPVKYLKDWHFQQSYGTDMYSPHPAIAADWVNREKWSDTQETPFNGDYRFVYYGVKGSWTRFHSDVMSSHSWSANVVGRKRWLIIPPGREKLFESGGQMVHDMRHMPEVWEEAGVIDFEQSAGQVVFVPANWWHQVHNLEDTISINHNFINASNVGLVRSFLVERAGDVRQEIGHLKDVFGEGEWRKQCETVLRADAGLNLGGLRRLLHMVIESRKEEEEGDAFEQHEDVAVCDSARLTPSGCSCSVTVCSGCLCVMHRLEKGIARRELKTLEKEMNRLGLL